MKPNSTVSWNQKRVFTSEPTVFNQPLHSENQLYFVNSKIKYTKKINYT